MHAKELIDKIEELDPLASVEVYMVVNGVEARVLDVHIDERDGSVMITS